MTKMNTRERTIAISILFLTATFVSIDIISDIKEGSSWQHAATEGTFALIALIGVLFLLRNSFQLKHSLKTETLKYQSLQSEAIEWQRQAKIHIEGLSQEIERQLSIWKLSSSEKEVAFLLLKGLSLKEIAEIRKTSEKTARTQSTAIYEKSGLSGRSELSAFFLEDLFSK